MAERAGQGVSNYIVRTRDVDYVTGEFGDVGEMARLSGRPWGRGPEKGVGKRFFFNTFIFVKIVYKMFILSL